jgi:hypothetical protein
LPLKPPPVDRKTKMIDSSNFLNYQPETINFNEIFSNEIPFEWIINSINKENYNKIFYSQKDSSGYITGTIAKSLFFQTNLPQNQLAHIWRLSDVDKDGKLNQEEFLIAMHLINAAVRGIKLPNSLPSTLYQSIFQ